MQSFWRCDPFGQQLAASDFSIDYHRLSDAGKLRCPTFYSDKKGEEPHTLRIINAHFTDQALCFNQFNQFYPFHLSQWRFPVLDKQFQYFSPVRYHHNIKQLHAATTLRFPPLLPPMPEGPALSAPFSPAGHHPRKRLRRNYIDFGQPATSAQSTLPCDPPSSLLQDEDWAGEGATPSTELEQDESAPPQMSQYVMQGPAALPGSITMHPPLAVTGHCGRFFLTEVPAEKLYCPATGRHGVQLSVESVAPLFHSYGYHTPELQKVVKDPRHFSSIMLSDDGKEATFYFKLPISAEKPCGFCGSATPHDNQSSLHIDCEKGTALFYTWSPVCVAGRKGDPTIPMLHSGTELQQRGGAIDAVAPRMHPHIIQHLLCDSAFTQQQLVEVVLSKLPDIDQWCIGLGNSLALLVDGAFTWDDSDPKFKVAMGRLQARISDVTKELGAEIERWRLHTLNGSHSLWMQLGLVPACLVMPPPPPKCKAGQHAVEQRKRLVMALDKKAMKVAEQLGSCQLPGLVVKQLGTSNSSAFDPTFRRDHDMVHTAAVFGMDGRLDPTSLKDTFPPSPPSLLEPCLPPMLLLELVEAMHTGVDPAAKNTKSCGYPLLPMQYFADLVGSSKWPEVYPYFQEKCSLSPAPSPLTRSWVATALHGMVQLLLDYLRASLGHCTDGEAKMQQLLACFAAALVREPKRWFLVIQGMSGTGKSSFLSVLRHALGEGETSGYCLTLSEDKSQFLQPPGKGRSISSVNGHDATNMGLDRKALVVTDEVTGSWCFASSFVKSQAAGIAINQMRRACHGNNEARREDGALFFVSNCLIKLPCFDPAVLNRMVYIRYDQQLLTAPDKSFSNPGVCQALRLPMLVLLAPWWAQYLRQGSAGLVQSVPTSLVDSKYDAYLTAEGSPLAWLKFHVLPAHQVLSLGGKRVGQTSIADYLGAEASSLNPADWKVDVDVLWETYLAWHKTAAAKSWAGFIVLNSLEHSELWERLVGVWVRDWQAQGYQYPCFVGGYMREVVGCKMHHTIAELYGKKLRVL